MTKIIFTFLSYLIWTIARCVLAYQTIFFTLNTSALTMFWRLHRKHISAIHGNEQINVKCWMLNGNCEVEDGTLLPSTILAHTLTDKRTYSHEVKKKRNAHEQSLYASWYNFIAILPGTKIFQAFTCLQFARFFGLVEVSTFCCLLNNVAIFAYDTGAFCNLLSWFRWVSCLFDGVCVH